MLGTSQKDITYLLREVHNSPKHSLDLTTNLSEIQRKEEHRKWYHGDAVTTFQAVESSPGKKTWFPQQQQKFARKQRAREETYISKDTKEI